MLSDVPVKLGHEALAEPHDLSIGPALGIEIGTTLTSTDGHSCQGVFEDLLKTQEFDDPEIDRRVETEPTLVGAEGAVELYADAAVDHVLTFVGRPRYSEDDLSLRLADALDDLVLGEFRVLFKDRPQGLEHFLDRMVELLLCYVSNFDIKH